MKGNIEERACELAAYIIENRTTVRDAAKKFGISKSTVHKDIQERLPLYNRSLYLQVKEILDENKAERHIRGGIATRRKYRGEFEAALWSGRHGISAVPPDHRENNKADTMKTNSDRFRFRTCVILYPRL